MLQWQYYLFPRVAEGTISFLPGASIAQVTHKNLQIGILIQNTARK